MTAEVGRRPAALVVERALGRVFDARVVGGLREDSPLSSLGLTDADAVCVADAIALEADGSGWLCVLDDEALQHAHTVADLIDAVVARATIEDGKEEA